MESTSLQKMFVPAMKLTVGIPLVIEQTLQRLMKLSMRLRLSLQAIFDLKSRRSVTHSPNKQGTNAVHGAPLGAEEAEATVSPGWTAPFDSEEFHADYRQNVAERWCRSIRCLKQLVEDYKASLSRTECS